MAREMKYSGTQWLKDIPSKWKVGKIQGLYFLRNTKVSDKDYEPLSVTKDGILPQLDSAAKTNAHDDRKLVKKGDFAINSRSDRRGSCGISDRDGSVSLINTILAPTVNMDPGYYNWLFHTTEFADEFYKWGHGIVDDLWTTNWQDMKKILIPSPSLQEQQLIASFLDSKCSNIDSLVADITKEIELLKEYRKSVIYEAVTKGLVPNVEMKDCGIEWIGEIPEDWKLKPIKYIKENSPNSFVDGPFGSNLKSVHFVGDGDVYVIESGLISSGKFIHKEMKTITNEHFTTISRSECKQGDIIIAKIGANYGMAAELPFLDKKSVVSGNSLKLTLDNSKMKNLLLILQMELAKKLGGFIGIVNETAQPALSLGILNNFKILCPPKEEQEKIINFLNTKCFEIESLITDKQHQIDKLTNYKKSIIYEYVTGKKEVPAC